MNSLSFNPPKSFSAPLHALEKLANSRLYYFGGIIRDLVLGNRARDFDLLVFGNFQKLTSLLDGGHHTEGFQGTILHSDEYNCLLEQRCQEKTRIDFINGDSFLKRYGKELGKTLPKAGTNDELVRLAVAFSDFTINGCARGVEDGSELITHPQWEQDIRSKTIALSSPQVLSIPYWPGIKALTLAVEIGGTLSPLLVSSLHEYAERGGWRRLPSDLLYIQMVRLFCSANPLQSANLLAESGLLRALFLREAVPTARISLIKSLVGSPRLPSLGTDGFAPWFLAALLARDDGLVPRSAEAPLLSSLRPEHAQSLRELTRILPSILEGGSALK